MIGASVNDLVYEWCRVIVFGKIFVQISEISTNIDGSMFFHEGYRVRNPRCVSDKIDESNFVDFIDFLFD